MIIPIRWSALFVLMGVALLYLGVSPGAATLAGPSVKVDPAIMDALESSPDVAVIIALKRPPVALRRPTISELQDNAALRQANVLDSLAENDFVVSYQFDSTAGLAGRITASGVTALSNHPDVVAIGLGREVFLTLGQSVNLIGADDVQLAGINGQGITVAVLDSGVDSDHPDLSDSIVGGACFLLAGGCPPAPAFPAEDDNGHGTHVSGIITGNGGVAPPGVAPQANVFAYKIFRADGQFYTVDFTLALDDILTFHLPGAPIPIDFINMSFGDLGEYPDGGCLPDPVLQLITDQIKDLRAEGTLAFASSGNDGHRNGISWPACIGSVIAVGATYDSEVGSQSWYTPEGVFICKDTTTTEDQVACGSNASDHVTVVAPGCRTTATKIGGGVIDLCGTSMAAPHAAAVAALLKSKWPNITPTDISENLKITGVPVIDDYDPNNVRVEPRVDAFAAILEDSDGDGCADGSELRQALGSESTGGRRDRNNPWDYYDVAIAGGLPGTDGVIDLPNDIFGVILHFSPGGGPPYDVNFDRGPTTGPDSWNMTAPDGVIDLPNDILGVILQFGHNCA